jgi:hypothetical protein
MQGDEHQDVEGLALADMRVPFGDGPAASMPLAWAESMLRGWRQRDPEGFGFALAETATGVAPKAPRRAGRHPEANGAQ